jgi:hypothetical protein
MVCYFILNMWIFSVFAGYCLLVVAFFPVSLASVCSEIDSLFTNLTNKDFRFISQV